MADNVAITAGTGTDIGADEISSVKYQRIKLIHGADGTNDGDVSTANPFPVVQTGALPAGANAIGKLAANSGVDIGDVDVTSCALPTGASTSAKQDTGNTSLGNIDAKLVSGTDIGDVTINNAGGAAAVNIQDGGNTITVDGTVAVTNADMASCKTALELLDNAVDGNYLNVNANIAGTDVDGNSGNKSAQTQRVCIATDDVNLSAIKTAVELIDNTVGAIAGSGSPTIDSYTHASINLAAGANQVLVSSAASKQIWVYGIGFTVNAAGTVSFQDEDDTAITGIMPIDAKGGMVVSPSGNFAMPIWKLATDKDLEVDVVTSELDGWIDYAIVSV